MLPDVTMEWLALSIHTREIRVQISVRRRDILIDLFAVFLSPSRKMRGEYLKLGHNRFLIYPLQFIIEWSFSHSTQSYSPLSLEAVNTSETSVYFYETTRCSFPEGCLFIVAVTALSLSYWLGG
jgi:hypothetical protein